MYVTVYLTLQNSFTDTSSLLYMSHRKPCKTPIFVKCHYNSGEVEGSLWQRPLVFFFYFLPTVSGAHRPRDTQRQYKQSHIMDSHNKLTLGSGWCSTQLMPVLIRAWKYYLGLAARSKKSILSQVINSALSDCSPIPGSSMSLSWLLPLKFSLWLALSRLFFHRKIGTYCIYIWGLLCGLTPTWQKNNDEKCAWGGKISRAIESLTKSNP